MGTRSGDLDPVIPIYLADSLGMSSAEIDKLLNKQSGLLGLTGQNDLRDIEERQSRGDAQAQLALDMVAYRIKEIYWRLYGRSWPLRCPRIYCRRRRTQRHRAPALLCRFGKSGHHP